MILNPSKTEHLELPAATTDTAPGLTRKTKHPDGSVVYVEADGPIHVGQPRDLGRGAQLVTGPVYLRVPTGGLHFAARSTHLTRAWVTLVEG